MKLRIGLVEPGSRSDLAEIEKKIFEERGRISLLYQVLLNSPDIAQGWESFLSAVRNRNSLSAQIREMIILRVAVLNRAPYEFEAHYQHALKAGVQAEKIESLCEDTLNNLFTDVEKRVIELTDAMTLDIEVSDDLYRRVKADFNDREMVDLTVTIAAYNMVSRFLNVMQIGN